MPAVIAAATSLVTGCNARDVVRDYKPRNLCLLEP